MYSTETDPEVLKAQGNEAFRANNHEQAVNLWRKAISFYSEPVEACISLHSNIANALLKIGDYEACCVEATAGLELFERGLGSSILIRGKLFARRAEAYEKQGTWEQALLDYTKAVSTLDASSAAHYREKANRLYHKIFGGPACPFVEPAEYSAGLTPLNQRRQSLVFRPRPHPPTSSSPPARVFMTTWNYQDNLYCWGGKRTGDTMPHLEVPDPQTLFVYSAQTGDWREVQPTAKTYFPNPRCSGAAVAWNGSCYLHSGEPRVGPSNKKHKHYPGGMLSVWQLDLTTFIWTEYWKFSPKEIKKMKEAIVYEGPACAVTKSGKMLTWGGGEHDFIHALKYSRPAWCREEYGTEAANLLRIFDIPARTWSVIQGGQNLSGHPLPSPRQLAVGWVHENFFYIFGGHGTKREEARYQNRVTLSPAKNDLDRFNLEQEVWESIPMMGDHPPPLQEAGCAAFCSPEMAAKLPDGRPAVFIFGGFIMGAPPSIEAAYGLSPMRWPPGTLQSYLKDHYRLDLRTLHWSRLHQVGSVRPLGLAGALAFVPASAPHRLVITQGYGHHPLNVEQVRTPMGITGMAPVTFDSTYDVYPSACPLSDKGDLFPISTGRDRKGAMISYWAVPQDELFQQETGCHWRGGKMDVIRVIKYKADATDGSTEFDYYYGPSTKVLDEISRTPFCGHGGAAGGATAPGGCLRPANYGHVLKDASDAPGRLRDELLAAWVRERAARQRQRGEALLMKYRARAAARAGKGARGLILRVELRVATPPLAVRRVRVGSGLTLRELHDLVLCPALGWQRAYHAYAFRELPSPRGEAGAAEGEGEGKEGAAEGAVWFGNPEARAVDMMHVPFFYGGALVKDKGVLVDSMFEAEGARLGYVYDLGHYWWHTITLESYCKEDSVALLDGWGQAAPEDVEGGAWAYGANVLRGLLSTAPSELSVDGWWANYWPLLGARNNVGTPTTFDPLHFDLKLHQKRLVTALGSRVSVYDGRYDTVPETTVGRAAFIGSLTRDQLHINQPPPEARQRCVVCGAGAGLNRCAGCGLVFYCGRQHQKEHWKGHKGACKAAQGRSKNSDKDGERKEEACSIDAHHEDVANAISKASEPSKTALPAERESGHEAPNMNQDDDKATDSAEQEAAVYNKGKEGDGTSRDGNQNCPDRNAGGKRKCDDAEEGKDSFFDDCWDEMSK